MNKKTKIYVLVLIWGAVFAQFLINSYINREEKMVESVMAQTVSSVVDGTVKLYAFYSDEELSKEACTAMVEKLAEELGIYGRYKIYEENTADGEVTALVKDGEYADTTIKVIRLVQESLEGDKKFENYISTEVVLTARSADKAYELKEELVELYEGLGMKASANVYLCSQRRGNMSESEKQELVDEFLSEMNAREVKAIDIDGITCVYGYCRSIGDYVYQDDRRVNVNIAISYDENEDITYIHQAVPFIDKSF